jgi:hypothetical protein
MWRWPRKVNIGSEVANAAAAAGVTQPADHRLKGLDAERETILDELHRAASRGLIPDALFWRYRKNAQDIAKLNLMNATSARDRAISSERALRERLFAELDQPEPTPQLRVIGGLEASFAPRRSAANG